MNEWVIKSYKDTSNQKITWIQCSVIRMPTKQKINNMALQLKKRWETKFPNKKPRLHGNQDIKNVIVTWEK